MTKFTCIPLLTFLLTGIPQTARADDSVQRKLDQRVDLKVDDAPLDRALQYITRQTELPVTLSSEAAAYLPYGENTEVSVRMDECTLGDGLARLGDELGMEFVPAGDGVRIVPSAPLIRLGRRATWDELKTLAELSLEYIKAGSDDYEELEDLLQFRAGDDGTMLTWDTLEPHLARAGAGYLDDLLTAACAATAHTWYPWSESIVVLPVAQQTRRQLQRTVSLRFDQQPLAEALHAISQDTGLRIIIEPQAVMQLSDDVRRRFTILADGVTAEEAIIKISMATGLGYRIEGDTVVLHATDKPKVVPVRKRETTTGRDPIVGKVIIPSPDGKYTYEFFIRASDLTETQERHRQKLIRQATEALNRDLSTGLDE